MIGEFLIIKESHGVNVKDDQESNKLINSLMEASANASYDLQEMASQSFNIILGALLAYMSASANVVFQAFTSSDKPLARSRLRIPMTILLKGHAMKIVREELP